MHEAGATAPGITGLGVRYHRHIAQLRHLQQSGLDPGIKVDVLWPSTAPVKRGRPCDAFELHVFDDRLERCEAGTRSQQHNRLVAVFAQEEAAIGAFDAQDVLLLHNTENVIGELAAGQVPDVEFESAALGLRVRCIGHGIAATHAALQHEFHVLASVVGEVFVGRQLQAQQHYIVRLLFQQADAGRHFADLQGASLGHLA